jgi:4-hydroxy-3-methylbut-2-enyl diphosphate reductase
LTRSSKTQTYYQKGLGLRAEIRPQLRETYRSRIVDVMRANGFRLEVGELTFLLAVEFGFCYGVERAVEYAYETVAKFAGRRIFLTGEIIHNPHVNFKLQSMGIQFLPDGDGKYDGVKPDDVVIIPAFGVPAVDMALLERKGCVVVDTTCGSVLNVWKNVERYGRLGVTAVIHGKVEHEETKATFSRTTLEAGAHYLVIRDKAEAAVACRYIQEGGDRSAFIKQFGRVVSNGFDPDLHLSRIGLANQTTMLSSESLEIAEMLRHAMVSRYGEADMGERFHAFDTICSATQDRQDAVFGLRDRQIDLMIVIGGYNSSNTNNLAKIAAQFAPTFHIENVEAIVSASQIRHKPAGSKTEITTENWFPESSRTIGITAGASTPNNQIGAAIERISEFRGTIDIASMLGAHE